MASGNPHGLSDIGHFGSFQRVGGKAAGFINKKFFHPSSLRNQEKLWKAQTEDERETRKQKELEKRREEERNVEAMRKQLYLAGQGKASDLFVQSAEAASSALDLGEREKSEQKAAVEAERRRRAQLKRARAATDAEAEPGQGAADAEVEDQELAKSRYDEDNFVSGHSAVWGSWFSMEDKRWGFACCKSLEFEAECPLADEEAKASASKVAQSKKRRKGDEGGDVGGLQGQQRRGGGGTKAKAEDSELMDTRMFEAAARRKELKKAEEERKMAEKGKPSSYLTDLLSDPAAGDGGGGP
mmetsp:Transcript_49146/g.136581  ORF Transcript_49146/g.136581 Transcript_49146/m.136581 type:complete len:299 (-) Transcript_49146:15-911(-)